VFAPVTQTPTGAIVPRWEWRTFDSEEGDLAGVFAGLSPGKVEQSDELYLLSRTSDASVKVRGGLMDVKELQARNEDGLEQWLPVMKASFPLAAGDVARLFGVLGATAPELGQDSYTLDDVRALVGADPGLLALDVQKHRTRYTVDGVMAENSVIRAGRRARRTIVVEFEDPARVIGVARSGGMGARRNVNMASGLKAMVGFGARRYAVVDVGTNSVKFHIGERAADGSWTSVVDRAEVTRLGEGLDETGRLGADAVARTVDAIAGMVDEARGAGVEEIAAVGTAGMRIAPNAQDVVAAVRERTGVELEVISGEDEARLAYLAAVSAAGASRGSRVVFDTGGGSSQFTFGEDDRVDERFSVNVGAARFTERFGLDGEVSAEGVAEALSAIGSELGRLDGRPRPDVLIGMGGATTNLAAVSLRIETYDPDVVQGSLLERSEIDRQIELYRTRDADERRSIVGLQPGRAEVILAGACIVRTVLEKLGCESLTVSDRGLRHGLLVERFGG
jgi:exopolyphosphatase/guanosine-5'-triphosphate,3'-diphosphate pyrophosphatase